MHSRPNVEAVVGVHRSVRTFRMSEYAGQSLRGMPGYVILIRHSPVTSAGRYRTVPRRGIVRHTLDNADQTTIFLTQDCGCLQNGVAIHSYIRHVRLTWHLGRVESTDRVASSTERGWRRYAAFGQLRSANPLCLSATSRNPEPRTSLTHSGYI